MNTDTLGTAYGRLVDGFLSKGRYMSGMENGMETVTLRVNRFTPRPERGRERHGGKEKFYLYTVGFKN